MENRVSPFSSNPSGLKRAAVRSWSVTMVGQVGRFVIQLGTTAIIARILSPTDYGLIAMVSAFLAIIGLLKDLGLSQATIQRENITQVQVSGLFWLNVITGLVLAAVISAAAPVTAWFFDEPDLVGVTLAFAAMAPVSSLGSQHRALMQREFKFRSLMLRDIIATLAGSIVGVICALHGFRYWSLLMMQATSEVVGTAALWWQSGWRPSAPRWSNELKPLIRFGGTLTLSNVLGYLISGLDSLVLGHHVGPAGLGLYNRAQGMLARPLQQFLPPVMSVAYSVFSRMTRGASRFESAALQLIFMISVCSGIMATVFILGADWLVMLLLGPQWNEAIPIVRVLALFALVEPIASFLGMLLIAKGLPGHMLRWRIFSAGIVVVGIFAGLPWGPLGVASSYALSGLCIRMPLFAWYVSRAVDLPLGGVFRAIRPSLLAATLTTLGLMMVRQTWEAQVHFILALAMYATASVVLFMGVLCTVSSSRQRIRQTIELLKSGLLSPRSSTAT